MLWTIWERIITIIKSDIISFFLKSGTEPYPEGKLSITNKTGHFCAMKIPLHCLCLSEFL